MLTRPVPILAVAAIASLTLTVACSSDSSDPQQAPVPDIRTAATPAPAIEEVDGQTRITIHLSSPRAGGQTGSALLTSVADKTTVEVNLDPPRTEVQPIHIHAGTCDEIGPIVVNLENVIRGQSTSILDQPLESLVGPETLINVHASFDDFPTSTACAPLPEALG